MRHKWLLLPLLALLLLPASASRSDAKGDINFMLGFKHVDDFEDLTLDGDLENQVALGVEMTFRGVDWPVGIAVDLLGSGAEEEFTFLYQFDVEARTAELDVGVRKIWEIPGKPVRPFLGGGLALARGEIEASAFGLTADEDDTGVGFWLGGGVFWRIGDSFNIGLNLRYSAAEVEIEDEDIDVGGLSTGLLLGFGW